MTFLKCSGGSCCLPVSTKAVFFFLSENRLACRACHLRDFCSSCSCDIAGGSCTAREGETRVSRSRGRASRNTGRANEPDKLASVELIPTLLWVGRTLAEVLPLRVLEGGGGGREICGEVIFEVATNRNSSFLTLALLSLSISFLRFEPCNLARHCNEH